MKREWKNRIVNEGRAVRTKVEFLAQHDNVPAYKALMCALDFSMICSCDVRVRTDRGFVWVIWSKLRRLKRASAHKVLIEKYKTLRCKGK